MAAERPLRGRPEAPPPRPAHVWRRLFLFTAPDVLRLHQTTVGLRSPCGGPCTQGTPPWSLTTAQGRAGRGVSEPPRRLHVFPSICPAFHALGFTGQRKGMRGQGYSSTSLNSSFNCSVLLHMTLNSVARHSMQQIISIRSMWLY